MCKDRKKSGNQKGEGVERSKEAKRSRKGQGSKGAEKGKKGNWYAYPLFSPLVRFGPLFSVVVAVYIKSKKSHPLGWLNLFT